MRTDPDEALAKLGLELDLLSRDHSNYLMRTVFHTDPRELRSALQDEGTINLSYTTMFDGAVAAIVAVAPSVQARSRLFQRILDCFAADARTFLAAPYTVCVAVREYAEDKAVGYAGRYYEDGRGRLRAGAVGYAHVSAAQRRGEPCAYFFMPGAESRFPGETAEGDDVVLRGLSAQLTVYLNLDPMKLQWKLGDVPEKDYRACFVTLLREFCHEERKRLPKKNRPALFVGIHDAPVEQVLDVVRLAQMMVPSSTAPVVRFLVTGKGADEVAARLQCPSIALKYADEVDDSEVSGTSSTAEDSEKGWWRRLKTILHPQGKK